MAQKNLMRRSFAGSALHPVGWRDDEKHCICTCIHRLMDEDDDEEEEIVFSSDEPVRGFEKLVRTLQVPIDGLLVRLNTCSDARTLCRGHTV
jgi:hypothetical protein